MIHGRTREQGFRGRVDLNGIRQVVESVKQVPVIGNGDIQTVADAAHMLLDTVALFLTWMAFALVD